MTNKEFTETKIQRVAVVGFFEFRLVNYQFSIGINL